MTNKIVLTGIKPTGMPHFGNYIGALKPMIESAKTQKTIMFIADLHALNTIYDPKTVREHTYQAAAIMMALGIDLNNTLMFRQSDVEQIYQLNTLLMNVTPKGLMNRAHSYKAAMDKNIANGVDVDAGVNMGLYTYPILMSADILLYGADIVPVGADQKQHVEFARDIAGHFNAIYGETFKMPEPVIGKESGLIPGLDGRKMSKSYDNTIPLMAPENELKKKIMRIITDSKTPEESKNPDESTIFQLYKHFATEPEIAEFADMFRRGGMGYGTAKTILFDKINGAIKDARTEYERLMENKHEIDAVLNHGAQQAKQIAERTMQRVKKAMLG
ncbi:MAG: tryptophan--tRNA ligase [Alphaproteobacteria bacterium]|nr:tryptophan--tRNA ligase [Alphaproteobacteria bacterium]